MKKKHLIIGLLVVVGLSYYAFKDVSIAQLVKALSEVNYLYMIPALLMVTLTFVFRAIRWRYLVCSIKQVKTSELASPLMIGFMSNVLPARAGEIIRPFLLSKKINISFSASFATIFVERLLDMLMFLILLVWVLLFSADTFATGESGADLMDKMVMFGWTSLIGSVGIFAFAALLQYKNELAMKIVFFFIRPLPEKWRKKITGMVISFTDGLKILKDLRGFLAALITSVLVWISMILTYYPLFMAFGIDAQVQVPVLTAAIVTSLAIGIFISVAPAPGFLGSFNAACVVALHEIFGVTEAIAASFSIVAWLVAMGSVIVVGLIYAVKDNITFTDLSATSAQAE